MLKKLSLLFSLLVLTVLCSIGASAGFLVDEKPYTEDNETKIIDHVVYKLHETSKGQKYYEVYDWFDTYEASETLEEINIVPEIDGIKVTHIQVDGIDEYVSNNSAYWKNKNYSVKKVTIPNTITEIGNYFFSVLDGVEELTIPASVKTIKNCSKFDDLRSTTFYEMENLKKITFLGNLESLGGFENCKKLETVVLKGSVKEIGSYAFNNCTALKSFKIPDTVKKIGVWAFRNTALTSVTIPYSVETFGNYGGGVFGNCKNLTKVVFDATKSKNLSIPASAFYNCTSLKTIVFPESCGKVTVGNGAFRNCKAITSVRFPATCQELTIGNDAFRECASLKTVIFPQISDSVAIGYRAFRNCQQLYKVYYTNAVERIYGGAFRDCVSLTSFTVYDKVKFIGLNAFYNCKNLKTFTINGTTKYPRIYENAFYNTAKGITFTAKNEVIAKKWKSQLTASGLKNMNVRYVKYISV